MLGFSFIIENTSCIVELDNSFDNPFDNPFDNSFDNPSIRITKLEYF